MAMTAEILFLVLVFSLGLTLRYLPHILYYLPGTSDMFFHFSKIRNPSHGEEVLIYPPLLHWLFRRTRRLDGTIPERTLIRLIPLCDIGTAILLYIFLRGPFGVEISILAISIFLVTPGVVIQGITFSPRSIGLLFLVSALLCLTLPFPFNYFALVPVTMTLLSHRLATQTLFFITIGLSFLDWQAGVILLIGIGLAILISRGQYLRILRSHISFIFGYIKGERFPNQRITGILLAPTVIGLIIYVVIRWFLAFISFPLTLFGFLIQSPVIIHPYFENLFLIWGIMCLLLLVLWLAGESYRYTYYAGAPFAFFCAYITQSSPIFLLLAQIILGICLVLSLYMTSRFQHLEKETVALLRSLESVEGQLLVPKRLKRATDYFARTTAIKYAFATTTAEIVNAQIRKDKITLVVVDRKHLDWFPDSKQVKQAGDWYLLQV